MVAGIRAVNGYLDGSMENINNDESEDDPLEFIIIFFVISEDLLASDCMQTGVKHAAPIAKNTNCNVFLPKL